MLTNAAGAVIGTDNRATVTINDDDDSALPTISLADSSESEGTSSFTETTLTLSAPSAQDVQVTWRPLAASWLGDRAADSSDWRVWGSPSSYTITIPANTTSTQLRLLIRDDSIPEHDERFIVALYDPVNAILGTQHAWHTIIDDDLPVLSVGDQTVSEDATTITFELELHAPGVVASSVDYATAVHTSAGDAAASPVEDYTHTSGTVTFAPGVSTATISVPILSDSNDELDETFLLILSDPACWSSATQAPSAPSRTTTRAGPSTTKASGRTTAPARSASRSWSSTWSATTPATTRSRSATRSRPRAPRWAGTTATPTAWTTSSRRAR